jgi:polyphosphate kinase 2 (PPK2 family)
VILLKYWLEVSPDEQTRRCRRASTTAQDLEALAMDLQSYSRWYDYSRARDDMFERTDSALGALARGVSDDKKARAAEDHRHILSKVPHRKAKAEKVKLPKRQKAKGYKAPRLPVQSTL